MINYNEVIKCGEKLYRDINPNSNKDVPSYFFEKLEGYYELWERSHSDLNFYEFCKDKLKIK